MLRPNRRPMGMALAFCLAFAACAALPREHVKGRPDAVTTWSLVADQYGRGGVNWRTIAIMHMAMHDGFNAARPTYARWYPPAAGEPPGAGADPAAAMAAAAHASLMLLHPDRRVATDRVLSRALAAIPDGPAKDAGVRLGAAIGAATAHRRDNDGAAQVRFFPVSDQTGRWHPTPRLLLNSRTEGTVPFLYKTIAEFATVPPPALDSQAYQRDLEEVRRDGAAFSKTRTLAQTGSAIFWAGQSSQRGFVALAIDLLGSMPRPGGIGEHARTMSQLAVALADSAVLVWNEKEKYGNWRPVTAIRAATVDRDWLPAVETPPFPEYPSGHAADCFVGAGVLAAAFPDLTAPIFYEALAATANADGRGSGMGLHTSAGGPLEDPVKSFPTLAAAAEDCYNSRVWAGVHFRFAEDEARRVAGAIVARAVAMVPPLSAARR